MASTFGELLARFRAICDPGPFGYADAHHHVGGQHRFHVVFSVMIHGDEYGTLPAAVALAEALSTGALRFRGRATVLLGNPEAGEAERRFLDSDLNRAWAFLPGADGHEHRRARALRPILDDADLLLDLHQTILASHTPFWIFPWDPVFGAWARALGTAPVGLTRAPGAAFAVEGQRCVDEYVRDRGKPAFCVELGPRGLDDAQADNALRTMRRMLTLVDAIAAGETTLTREAAACEPIRWYTTVHQEAWGDPHRRLRAGLANWHQVKAGEDLAAPGSPPIVAPADGALLFPKYPPPGDPLPGHLFHLAAPLARSPDAHFAPEGRLPTGGTMDVDTRLAELVQTIEQAEQNEARTGRTSKQVSAHLERKQGRAPTNDEVARGVDFVRRYVRSVPAVLREALQRSAGTFAEDKMRRMVEAATAYWDTDEDVIPDAEGLYGILDDAYCTLLLVEALDDRYHEQTAERLVSAPLHDSNLAIRRLLGPSIAATLEDYVDDALDDATMTQLLDSLQGEPLPARSGLDTAEDDILRMFGVL